MSFVCNIPSVVVSSGVEDGRPKNRNSYHAKMIFKYRVDHASSAPLRSWSVARSRNASIMDSANRRDVSLASLEAIDNIALLIHM